MNAIFIYKSKEDASTRLLQPTLAIYHSYLSKKCSLRSVLP
jgi:hypothetical protein